MSTTLSVTMDPDIDRISQNTAALQGIATSINATIRENNIKLTNVATTQSTHGTRLHNLEVDIAQVKSVLNNHTQILNNIQAHVTGLPTAVQNVHLEQIAQKTFLESAFGYIINPPLVVWQ